MINFQKTTLANGLRVLVHEDSNTPMATVNILYDVGARDEDPHKTGFAHLFEHLMFGGSANIADFDSHLQKSGGNNNAFTTNDLTNYYDVLPAVNLETAFWLEADRMRKLDFSERSLEVQRKVVSEEFKENYLNQPYGDAWHLLRAMAYKKHPYRWPTIGLELSHVENATLGDVEAFFYKHYRPARAILAVSGGIKADQVFDLAQKWFGDIEKGPDYTRHLPTEPKQTEARRQTITAKVPVPVLYKAWHMGGRDSEDYIPTDLLSDVMSTGESSRMYRKLIKEDRLFAELDAYILGSMDAGLFVVEGKLAEGVDMPKAEAAVDEQINEMITTPVKTSELEKVVNQVESFESFGNMNSLNKAMKLAYYELLGDPDLINTEIQKYRSVSPAEILNCAEQMFRKENSSTLHYLPRS